VIYELPESLLLKQQQLRLPTPIVAATGNEIQNSRRSVRQNTVFGNVWQSRQSARNFFEGLRLADWSNSAILRGSGIVPETPEFRIKSLETAIAVLTSPVRTSDSLLWSHGCRPPRYFGRNCRNADFNELFLTACLSARLIPRNYSADAD